MHGASSRKIFIHRPKTTWAGSNPPVALLHNPNHQCTNVGSVVLTPIYDPAPRYCAALAGCSRNTSASPVTKPAELTFLVPARASAELPYSRKPMKISLKPSLMGTWQHMVGCPFDAFATRAQ